MQAFASMQTVNRGMGLGLALAGRPERLPE